MSTASSARQKPLRFKGAANFRQRILLATLSLRSIRIDDIRAFDEEPGLRDYEVSLLRLVDKISNGCVIQINETGTGLRYKPGLLVGGQDYGVSIEHECPPSRGIGYFIEPLLALAPFAKKKLAIVFTGVTNNNKDVSLDVLRTVTLPTMKHVGMTSGLEIKVLKRGAPPLGGGEVSFTCPVVKELQPFQLLNPGMIKRVRGVAYTTRCSPQMANRMVESARGILNNLLPDVYIYTDHYKGKDSGASAGFALTLVAESTTGCFISAQTSASRDHPDLTLPEDVGKHCAKLLLHQVAQGGCVDSTHQSLLLLLMLLGPEDISKIRLGPLTQSSIKCLRLIREFFGVTYRIRPDAHVVRADGSTSSDHKLKEEVKPKKNKSNRKKDRGNDQNELVEEEPEEAEEIIKGPPTVVVSCLGLGFQNFARRTV